MKTNKITGKVVWMELGTGFWGIVDGRGNEYRPVNMPEQLKQAGMVFSATSPNGVLMEIAELPKTVHPFFLGTQFHPEFQSSLLHPHPLFVAFLEACKKK